MNPLYWEIMNRRNRGFYGNSGGQQIGFTQNGDSSMGRFVGYDPRMDNQYDNRYPYVDDDRVRNAQRNGFGGENGQHQMNGYTGNHNGYPNNGGRDFQITRKGGN